MTGGSGKLGTELQKYIKCDAPSHQEFNIMSHTFIGHCYDLVIHAAAYTDVDMAEEHTEEVFDINLGGTLNLLYEYGLTPFVYISSEYAKNPVNMYSASKYAAELAVKALAEHYLIIRTLFKKGWESDTAWDDQWTCGDYVEVIAPIIIKEIRRWDLWPKFVYVGTGRKTMYDLAKRTKPDVKPSSLKDWHGVPRPYDYI